MDKEIRRNKRSDPLGNLARQGLTPEVAAIIDTDLTPEVKAIIDAHDGWPAYDEDGNVIPKGLRRYRRVI